MIVLSVKVPMFRARYIAWLALESLCRQVGVNFKWELVIAEEQINDEVFGYKRLLPYSNRLKKVGCVEIKYISLSQWIPLSTKIGVLIEHCNKNSKVVTFQSADYYSSPYILSTIWKVFSENPGIEWFGCGPHTIFYDILTGISKMTANGPKGSGRAVLLSLAKKIKRGSQVKTCDKWFYQSIYKILGRTPKTYMDTTNWKYSFNVHGFHNCTLKRDVRMRQQYKGWNPVSFDWKTNIPSDIMERTVNIKQQLPRHKFGLGKNRIISDDELQKIITVRSIKLK